MNRPQVYAIEPWQLRETHLDLRLQARSESLFSLSNGHLGMRGNLDEGYPHALPGTYLNSFYELRPLPYAEGGYGYPESGQTIVNVTDGKVIRLLVDDEPFDVRDGRLLRHERVLDLRDGVLRREVEWRSPAGSVIRVRSTRLVSLTHPSTAAIAYEVEPVDAPVRVIVQSELVANEELPGPLRDPRVSAVLRAPLVPELSRGDGTGALLMHVTRESGLHLAAAMDHIVTGPPELRCTSEAHEDLARTTVVCRLAPGQRLRLVKLLAYSWSERRSRAALRDRVAAALAGARYEGWDGLLRAQRATLDTFWDSADVEVDGDAEVQQAVRLALFHVLQAGAQSHGRPIAAKGLTGPGYDGHVFWDTERFVLPVLTAIRPEAAEQALRWRHSTLGLARERAATLGWAGAAFPWRTIRGQECSGYWPAGTAALHVGADIADAVVRYVDATADTVFERDVGVDLLVETARLWASFGHHDRDGAFHLDGVTGPDEYTAIADDNVYTNLMARRNLTAAADAVERHPDRADALGVSDTEITAWRAAAAAMSIPYDDQLGVHPQVHGFTLRREWDFGGTRPDEYPLLLHFPYLDLYRSQVVKQADLVLALHWCGDAFSPGEKARDFAYYEQRTVRDSSLSACAQAVVAAEVGHLELAHDYIGEAVLTDLYDLHRNTRDGLHIASLAGAWLSLVAGLGGMRDHHGVLSFAPRLPRGIERLAFSLLWRGLRLRVTIRPHEAVYSLRGADGGDAKLELWHHGTPLLLTTDAAVSRPIPPVVPLTPEPSQPAGRGPVRRRTITTRPGATRDLRP
ncbi:glycoside hydrolase family 65 protein [Actinoplanes sp. LDG1-06]|uniref:Glycoside hydrolase family 65 protein n=1 Tax=Paractinoplanes ovalisporus TaxID=2810368 RepID=A0ABS2AAL2_9ACTN|nr:glycoside hydrolase family 65 protein [Actinoplanes ovalisporus]MBM2616403.1 glycoside hydrolase family 65 protein [Actinoplanes ovalisporus]